MRFKQRKYLDQRNRTTSLFFLCIVVIVFVGNNGEKNSSEKIFIRICKINKMSAPGTPTKSAGSKRSDSKNSRGSVGQTGTPPIGSGQRRSAAGSQLGSPVVRSGAASAASPSGTREKLGSAANKQSTASPIPSMNLYFDRSKLFVIFHSIVFRFSD